MTDSTAAPRPAKRWRIERIPGKPLYSTGERMALPLWLVKAGEHVADVEFEMTLDEAEQLHAALCYALDKHPVPVNAPACRKPVQTSPSFR